MSDTIKNAGTLLRDCCHSASYEAGWWTHLQSGTNLRNLIRSKPVNNMEEVLCKALVAQKLALVHSEVSEGLEGNRKNLMDDKLPHRSMLEVELADAVIRIMDLAGALDLDIGGAIQEKLEFNAQRPDHKPEHRMAENGKAY